MAKIVAGCKFCGHFFKIEEVFEGVTLPCPKCKKMIEIKKMAGMDEKGLPTFEPALDEILEKIFKGEGSAEDLERLQKLGGAFKSRTVRLTKEEMEAQQAQAPSPTPSPAPPVEEPTKPHGVTKRVLKKSSRRIRKPPTAAAMPPSATPAPQPAQPTPAPSPKPSPPTAPIKHPVDVRPVGRPIWKYVAVAGVIVVVVVVVLLWWRAMVRREQEQKAADAVAEAYSQKRFDLVLLRAEQFLKDFPDSELAERVKGLMRRARKAKAVRQEMERIEDALRDGDVEDAVRRMESLDAGGTPFEKEVGELRRRVKQAKEEAEDSRILDGVESAIREKRWGEARKALVAFVPRTEKTRKRYERLKARVDKYDKEARKLLSQALSERDASNYREALRLVKLVLEDYGESVVAEDARQLLPELKEDMFWQLRKEGKQHMTAGRWRDAIRAFKEALKYKPNDAEVKSLLKQCEEKVGAGR